MSWYPYVHTMISSNSVNLVAFPTL